MLANKNWLEVFDFNCAKLRIHTWAQFQKQGSVGVVESEACLGDGSWHVSSTKDSNEIL